MSVRLMNEYSWRDLITFETPHIFGMQTPYIHSTCHEFYFWPDFGSWCCLLIQGGSKVNEDGGQSYFTLIFHFYKNQLIFQFEWQRLLKNVEVLFRITSEMFLSL